MSSVSDKVSDIFNAISNLSVKEVADYLPLIQESLTPGAGVSSCSIANDLSKLTVSEISVLVKMFDDKYAVKPAIPVAQVVVAGTDGQVSEVVEESPECSVLLKSAEVPSDQKINLIKIVREATGLSLLDVREILNKVANEAVMIKSNIPRDDAKKLQARLNEIGAKAVLE